MGTSLSLCPQLTSQIWVEQVSGKWAGRCDLMLFVRLVEKPQGFCCCGGAAGQHQGPRLWDILQPISLALLCLSRSPLPCEAAVSIPKLPSL